MAESVIIDENEFPLLKAVEYRASYSISSSSRTGKMTVSDFTDKDGNAYSPTLPGGYNAIGFCHVSSGSKYCPVTQLNISDSSTTANMMQVLDVRDASSTVSSIARVVVMYLRAPLAV